MRRFWLCAVIVALFVCLGHAQQDSSDEDPVNGDYDEGIYTNDVYSFTLKTPPDWAPATDEGRQRYADSINLKGNADVRVLLILFHPAQPGPGELPDAIVVLASKTGTVGGVSLAGAMKYLKEAPKLKRPEITRPASPFLLGGLLVAREDYHSVTNGREQYTSHLAISIRDRLISFQLYSATPQGLESTIKTLSTALEFKPDWVARSASTSTSAELARVSQHTAAELIDKKVPPQIPDSLYEQVIRDEVQMHIQVSREGNVEKIWTYEGNPNLTWPAVQAVRQWHFKPYLVSGQPSPFETTLTVDFLTRAH